MKERIYVDSSMMHSVGYDRKAHVLEIEFLSGRIYDYFDVDPVIHRELMDADSKGRYFLAEIEDVYEYTRVR